MRFAPQSAVAVAMASSLASANSVEQRTGLGLDLSGLTHLAKPISASVNLDQDLSGQVLAAGVLANPVVGDLVAVKEDLDISVICHDCYTRGNIEASISLEHVVPALKLSITDIEAKLDLDISASDATSIAVNLIAAPVVDLPFLGLNLGASIYLDLVLGLSAAIDVSAGVEIELVDEAVLSTNILSGEILSAAFTGLEVAVLPIEVRVGCTELHATLRLRVELDAGVDVDAGDILPILDFVPEIGAGLELAVFVNLVEYVGLFCPDQSCPVPYDSYGLNVGAIVGLDVSVENLARIHLAPTISTALLEAPTATHCATTGAPSVPVFTRSGSGSVTGSATELVEIGTGIATGIVTGTATATISASVTGSASEHSGFPTSDITIPAGHVISTVTQTATYTVTSCAASVPNCPGQYQGETTLVHTTTYTTICPVGATITDIHPHPTTATAAPTTTSAVVTHVTPVPCSSVSTFHPPTYVAYPTSSFPTAAPSSTPYPTSSAVQSSATTEEYPVKPTTEGYPVKPITEEYPVESATETYPVEHPSTTPAYPTAPYYPSMPVPPVQNGTTTCSPSTMSTYPVGPTGGGGYPTKPAPYPTVSYPVETPIPTAGASKQVASGLVLAVAGAILALF
ncbi:uncharacterized protein B0I36DRAFT_391675 [Microdochium trichocladiopsis]|uniref:Uncharacterized protein n=1 Tax=Microdochium trichocladiopsis TaxID=1682393 RepID=A0A9P8YI47_9PEZI|nr:uncharacterized protein B0I36DRAFT_391675 [Microdochium trichocladiopsis]KAH7040819.1 hypothetical protein B0I36DRAFT_391675 [Microdochium trichocladiopsis]